MKILSLNPGHRKNWAAICSVHRSQWEITKVCKRLRGVFGGKFYWEGGEKGKHYIQILHKVLYQEAGKIINQPGVSTLGDHRDRSEVTRRRSGLPDVEAAQVPQLVVSLAVLYISNNRSCGCTYSAFFFRLKSLHIISLIATIWEASVAFLNSNFHKQEKHGQK